MSVAASECLLAKTPNPATALQSAGGSSKRGGDGEFVGGCADLAGGFMEDKVFEMDKFAVDPQRGAGIGDFLPFEKTGVER